MRNRSKTRSSVRRQLLLLAALILPACSSGDAVAPVPTRASITGKVLDADSLYAGVVGARIDVVSLITDTIPQRTFYTGAGGRFTATDLIPSYYQVTLTPPTGYQTRTRDVDLRNIDAPARDTAVWVANFEIDRKRGAVAGSARAGSEAIGGLAVMLTRPVFETRTTTTNDLGSYIFDAVPAGPWTVTLVVEPPRTKAIGETGTRTVVVTASQTAQVSPFALAN